RHYVRREHLGLDFRRGVLSGKAAPTSPRVVSPRHGGNEELTMKYLMLAYTNAQAWQSAMADFDPKAPMPADAQAACDFYEQLAKELTESGEFVTTEGLADPTHTKTIRKRPEGGPEVTAGRYAEVKEVLAS